MVKFAVIVLVILCSGLMKYLYSLKSFIYPWKILIVIRKYEGDQASQAGNLRIRVDLEDEHHTRKILVLHIVIILTQ